MKLVRTVSTSLEKGYRVIKTKMTKEYVETQKQASTFGFDSNPHEKLIAIVANTLSNEEPVVIGYLNANAIDTLGVGDSVQYATNNKGEVKATVICRNNGTLELLADSDNAVRYSELLAGFNALKDDFNKLVSDFNKHTHLSASPGVPTGIPSASTPPVAAISSTASITKSKIEEIKVP